MYAKCYLVLFFNSTNFTLNRDIKDLADMVGIKKHLTFHVARHTFETTVTLLNGVPMETVSKLLGHTKLSPTKRYSRVIEQKISKDMGALKKVLNGHSNDDKPDGISIELTEISSPGQDVYSIADIRCPTASISK